MLTSRGSLLTKVLGFEESHCQNRRAWRLETDIIRIAIHRGRYSWNDLAVRRNRHGLSFLC